MTIGAIESDDEQDARATLLIAAHLLRTREFSDLNGLRTPGGDAAPLSADWLADLVERVAELPVSDLRRLTGMPSLTAGRRAVQSRFADAINEGTRMAFDALRAEGQSYTDALEKVAGLFGSDRRTTERRMKRADEIAKAAPDAEAQLARRRANVESLVRVMRDNDLRRKLGN